MWDATLAVHVVAGTVALVAGAVAIAAPKRRGVHTRTGEVYHAAVLTVCVSAAVLSVLRWDSLWWFLPIAAGSYAFALLGYAAAKLRRANWLRRHVSGMGGSYIAMTTALLVVNWRNITGENGVQSPWAWALPTLIGTPLLSIVRRRLTRSRGRQSGTARTATPPPAA